MSSTRGRNNKRVRETIRFLVSQSFPFLYHVASVFRRCLGRGESLSLRTLLVFFHDFVFHFYNEYDSRRAFINAFKTRIAFSRNNTVIFPVSDFLAFLCIFRTILNRGKITFPLDPLRFPKAFLLPPLVSSGEERTEIFAPFLYQSIPLPVNLRIDVLIYSFVRNTLSRMISGKSQGNLLRRPTEFELLFCVRSNESIL